MMDGQTEKLIEQMDRSLELVLDRFSSLESQIDVIIYSEDGAPWTIKDILAHLLVVETSFLSLFKEIALGGEGSPQDFDVNAFNYENWLTHRSADFASLLREFKDARKEMKEFVATLTDKDLAKIGRHPFLGVTDLGQMIKLLSVHAQTHLRDIHKKIASY